METKPKANHSEDHKKKEIISSTYSLISSLKEYQKLKESAIKDDKKMENLREEFVRSKEQKEENIKLLEKQQKEFENLQSVLTLMEIISQLQSDFIKRDFEAVNDGFNEITKMANEIGRQGDVVNLKNEYVQRTKLIFGEFVVVTEDSVTFPNKTHLLEINKFLTSISEVDNYLSFLFDELTNKFLVSLNTKNCEIDEKTTGTKITIALKPLDGELKPSFAISESTKLIKRVVEKLSDANFEVNSDLTGLYANMAIELAMRHSGGKAHETEKATQSLCEFCNIETVDIAAVAKKTRIGNTLSECRKIFKEGMLFGDAYKKMEEIFEGAPTDGCLTQLTYLALVEWSNDEDKLKTAFPIFAAVGTDESLRCMMLFQKRLNEISTPKA